MRYLIPNVFHSLVKNDSAVLLKNTIWYTLITFPQMDKQELLWINNLRCEK